MYVAWFYLSTLTYLPPLPSLTCYTVYIYDRSPLSSLTCSIITTASIPITSTSTTSIITGTTTSSTCQATTTTTTSSYEYPATPDVTGPTPGPSLPPGDTTKRTQQHAQHAPNSSADGVDTSPNHTNIWDFNSTYVNYIRCCIWTEQIKLIIMMKIKNSFKWILWAWRKIEMQKESPKSAVLC